MARSRLLFISYSHHDRQWLERILNAFNQRVRREQLPIAAWTDLEIQPGDDFREKIDGALKRAHAALLVVTKGFHESAFIDIKEVTDLLTAYRNRRLVLTWVHAERIDYRHQRYTEPQAVIPPEPPLGELERDAQDRRIDELVDRLIQILRGRPPRSDQDFRDWIAARRTKGWIACGLIVLVLLTMQLLSAVGGQPKPDRVELLHLLHQNHWLGYEPADYVPQVLGNVSDDTIRRELESIHRAGFTGIVTYGSRDDLARIPVLAEAEGLSVIMGVWNPLDLGELRNAYARRDVVQAYCVGHNGLDSMYREADLERAVRWLRRMTGKPVTTSQLSRRYSPTTTRLNLMGDFLFPDVHHNLGDSDLETDVKATMAAVQKLNDIARQYDRTLMLKMVMYPIRRDADSEIDFQRQAQFFTRLVEELRDPQREGITEPAYVLHGAFDAPWKQGGYFRPWDPFCGLFEQSHEPRPALLEWMWLHE